MRNSSRKALRPTTPIPLVFLRRFVESGTTYSEEFAHIDPRYISEVEYHDTPSPTVQQKIGRPKCLIESLPGFTAVRDVWFVVRTRCRAMMLSRPDEATDILSPPRQLAISFHLLASTPCGHISQIGRASCRERVYACV